MPQATFGGTSLEGVGNRGGGHLGGAVWIAYIYLMRVPIVMGVILLALPVLALTGLRPLLQNLFVLDLEGTVWTTTIAFALCWSILLTSRLVRLNGDRFGLPQALTRNTLNLGSTWWICCLALPLILAQFLERCEFALDRGAILWRAGAVLLGFVIA